MKIITESFAKNFGKVALIITAVAALFAGSIFLTASVAGACCDIPCPPCCDIPCPPCCDMPCPSCCPPPECSDGEDNDGDGLVDEADPGCWTDTNDPSSYDPCDDDESYDGPEYPQCADEIDNDGDGYVDADDSGCWTDPTDPSTYDPTDDSEYYEQHGSITVCKIIIDEEGDIVDGSENSGTFLISGISPLPMPNTSFTTTPFSFTDNPLTEVDNLFDAECVTHDNLLLGSYWYGEETITGSNWLAPKYNDQFTDTVATLDDFYLYNEVGNDSNADGNIVLSEGRPNRTLVVLNQYEIPPITIVATKIVCEDESYLPNWAANLTPIGEDTVSNFLAEVNATDNHCSIAQGWQFQWAPQGIDDPGDNIGEILGSDWTTFTESVQIDMEDLPEDLRDNVWVREVWNNAYIPFTGATTTLDESAEMYCHIDTINYDNFDRVDGIQAGGNYYCVGFNVPVEEEPFYGPYCGDGEVNQDWEQCDGTCGCTQQCQYVVPECSDLVLARVNVNEAWNEQGGAGDMTPDIYLGSTTNVIPAGTWFALYHNGSYFNDPDITGYENVPGLAIQRLDDSVRAVIHGSASSIDIEHINGNVEFYNATVVGQRDDNSGNNKLENGFNGTKDYVPGNDEVWEDGGDSHFWLTVNTADDGYYTDWEIIEDCVSVCSISGYKYDNLGGVLVNWIIGLAHIVDCAMEDEWADVVVDYSPQGTIAPERMNPQNALGVAERDDTINFVSLGMNGELILEFNNLVLNGCGDDIEIVETSFGDPAYDDYKEKAKVYASQDDINWSYLGIAYLDEYLDLDNGTLASDETTPFVLDWVKYMKIVDTSIQQGDGFDVDGVRAIHCGNYETVMSTTTDVSGKYCFTDVDAGDYAVYEEMQSGWSIWKVMTGQTILNYFVDSFFDVFVEVEVKDNETTEVDFYNQEDESPVYQCNDGIDNDCDGLIDYPEDPGCDSAEDDDEYNEPPTYPQCSDGQDNDGDGDVDEDDATCYRDGIYDGNIVDEENQIPVITLTATTTTITVGDSFDPYDGHATAGDFEDGDLTSDITASSSVSTTTPGTYYVDYDVDDSEGESAETKTLEVIVVEEPVYQCSDGIDNDGDGLVDEADPGCWTDTNDPSSYDPQDNDESYDGPEYPQCSDEIDNDGDGDIDEDDATCYREGVYDGNIDDEENQQPIITVDPATITITVGDSFDAEDGHATADDHEDGDITPEMTATGTVDTATAGTYYVDYDVVDSEGLAAETKTLEVVVEEEEQGPYCGDGVCNGSETCATCSQDCGACSSGGGGGGGWIPTTIIISHEDVEYLGDGNAMITWKTNIPATSQVVYGDDSINRNDFGGTPEYGYDSVNDESFSMKASHNMLIIGLTHGTQYYFRPVSDKSGIAEVVGKEVTYTFAQPAIPAPPVCTYLLEYIKLGADNNPVEVEKLETFLNEFEGENLPVNGIYEQADFEAVLRFQIKYREDILDPWNHDEATGYVYITTKRKINEIYCQEEFPLTASQKAEVAAFSTFLSGLQDATTGILEGAGTLDVGSIVGAADSDSDGVLADTSGAETSDETEGPGLLANILGVFGFGDDGEEESATGTEDEDQTDVLADDTGADTTDEKESRTLAATIFSGILDIATSFWFILILVVIAIILFFRIRGAEGRE